MHTHAYTHVHTRVHIENRSERLATRKMISLHKSMHRSSIAAVCGNTVMCVLLYDSMSCINRNMCLYVCVAVMLRVSFCMILWVVLINICVWNMRLQVSRILQAPWINCWCIIFATACPSWKAGTTRYSRFQPKKEKSATFYIFLGT